MVLNLVLAGACVRVIVALLCALGSGSAWSLTDAIHRPATLSARADQSLLLAVARAGARLVAVGERGVALVSDDHGKTWRQTKVPVSVTLTGVHFVGEKIGWATGHGGTLLNTMDGGETWSLKLEGVQLAKLILDTELALGKSADPARVAEATRLVADGPDKPLLNIRFISPEVGFAIGAYGLILSTHDGGKSWIPWGTHIPNPQGHHLYGIASVGDDLYIVGEQGAAFISSDRGESFRKLESPYRGTFFGAVDTSTQDCVVYGLRGNVFRISKHGSAWTKVDMRVPVSYSAAVRLNDGSVVMANQTGDLLRSKDGAITFASMAAKNLLLTSGLVEAADGALIVVGRGATRIANPDSHGVKP